MSSSKTLACLTTLLVAASVSGLAKAEAIACPALPGTHLQYVAAFDGKPEEHVRLIADHGDAKRGYWKLGYVYDHGRSVTVQCVYANKETRDFTLEKRVDECRYRIDEPGSAELDCT
ncbi:MULTISPECIES: STY0301 family protein [unclassified Caballeronia]|uniref:STY0301 family protein n=1 Tax=unclassified Caballeronia TaxID=2646786 RepID=UPI002028946E|nr:MULTISPECIES: STY0301 family protein [unclassified Caballeronia]MDR5767052.1 hypothetical protein [Caballeronia sp. LZ028]